MTTLPAVDIRNVTLRRNGIPVLTSVNLRVPSGVTQVIIGPSGAGKTTLLKVMCGLLKPDEGSVQICGACPGSSAFTAIRSRIGYIPQTMGLVQLLSAEDNVLLGSLPSMPRWRAFLPMLPNKQRAKARENLALLGLADKAETPAYRLSGGEKRRVAIARALMQNPVLLLADEILSDLDFVKSAAIMEVLQRLKRDTGLTIILVEHDLHVAQQFADCAAVMRDKRLRTDIDVTQVTHSKLHTFFD